jgi:hypothetical protein
VFYAANSITNLNLIGLDLTPATLPTWSNPAFSNVGGNSDSVNWQVLSTYQLGGLATSEIVSRDPGAPFYVDVQALGGDVTQSSFVLPAASRVYAGNNIETGALTDFQNLNPGDLSILQANAGSIIGSAVPIQMGGPGQLLVQAGGTVNLGVGGLTAVGSTYDQSLPSAQSARLTVLSGVSGQVDVANLDTALLGLRAVGEQQLTPDGIATILETFKANGGASAPPNLALVEQTLAALDARDAAKGVTPSFVDESQAMFGLFLGGAHIASGDINSYQTSIQTTGGSAIDLLAPAGNITVGLTTPTTGSQIGVITNSGGGINSYLSGNFTINSGKVVTAEGGDIEIFTSHGNIDAGRGAKTSITAPAPQRVKESDGSYQYILSNGVSVIGIQTVTTPANPSQPTPPRAGSIYLFAPEGIINAGEAGVTSGGNLITFAKEYENTSNFSSAGTTTGVPVTQSGSIASTLASSGSTSSSGADKAAEEAARSAASSAAATAAENFTAGILSVEVLGFGAQECKETDEKCLKGEK